MNKTNTLTPSTADNIAFLLPTLNEEDSVKRMILNIKQNYQGLLFIVDGFSTDNTVKIATELGVPVYSRLAYGKGSAIQKALEIAALHGKEYLLFTDCDMSYDPNNIMDILHDLDKYDLVIGVRPLKTIGSVSRRVGNVIATAIINIIYKGKVQDSLSGFKCLRVNKFKPLIKEDGFVVESLICLYALKYNMSINLVPINYYERVGTSKMSTAKGIKELIKLIKTIWADRL